MHEAVYRPMHEAVYGRFHRLPDARGRLPLHGAVYARRSKPMHEVVYAYFSKTNARGRLRLFRGSGGRSQ